MATKTNNSAIRTFTLKKLRDKNYSKSYKKAAYKDYKAAGGTLSFSAATKAKKKPTKRKGC